MRMREKISSPSRQWPLFSVRVQSLAIPATETEVKIAVLFGGTSSERDVSVASGAQVVEALRTLGHEVVAVDASRGALAQNDEATVLGGQVGRLPPEEIVSADALAPQILQDESLADADLFFLTLHGGSGEDGTVQAVLEREGIRYTGGDSRGSALAMDKDAAKRRFIEADVQTAPWLMAPASSDDVERELGYPVIVKPNAEGSTVGLTLVNGPSELAPAIELASRFDERVMLERYIPGRELTVGILGDAALAAGEIIPDSGGIFDYAAKYQAEGTTKIFPAELSESDTARIRACALAAHRSLGLQSYSRVDFRMDPDGNFWCLEINTLPGLSPSSLLPKSAKVYGIGFAELCEKICLAARP